MKVELNHAVEAFLSFMADQVSLIPKLGERFLGYGALGALKANPTILVTKVRPWAEMAGIVSDGMVDVDMLKIALKTAFENVPKVSYFGFTFDEEDAAALIKKLQMKEA